MRRTGSRLRRGSIATNSQGGNTFYFSYNGGSSCSNVTVYVNFTASPQYRYTWDNPT